MIDVDNLHAGEDFDELPDSYVIFITENDIWGQGVPIYRIERMNLTTGKPFNDGSHILYVNGMYRDESDIGKLMHDFSCSNPVDMHFKILAERASFFKEKEEGVAQMCRVMDELRKEVVQERNYEMAETLLKMGKLTKEEIAQAAEITVKEVEELEKELNL